MFNIRSVVRYLSITRTGHFYCLVPNYTRCCYLTQVGGRCDVTVAFNQITWLVDFIGWLKSWYCAPRSVHKSAFLSREKLFCGSDKWKQASSWRTRGRSAPLSSTTRIQSLLWSSQRLLLLLLLRSVHTMCCQTPARTKTHIHAWTHMHPLSLHARTNPNPWDGFHLCPCRDCKDVHVCVFVYARDHMCVCVYVCA